MPISRVAPCLWFDHQAEPAASHYVSIFRNARINAVTRYGEAGFEIHKRPQGSVMTVEFELDGQRMHRAERQARSSSSTRPSRCRSSATPRSRSTTTGTGCRRAATRARSSAAG